VDARVVVQEHEPVAGGRARARVIAGGESQVAPVHHDFRAWIVALDDGTWILGRPVVDDDDLGAVRRPGVRAKRGQAVREMLRTAGGEHDNGDESCIWRDLDVCSARWCVERNAHGRRGQAEQLSDPEIVNQPRSRFPIRVRCRMQLEGIGEQRKQILVTHGAPRLDRVPLLAQRREPQ
jgi:hypothetical protein